MTNPIDDGLQPPVIAMISKGRLNPAHESARLCAHGYRILHYIPEEADNAAQQCLLLRQAINDRPSAIVVAPIDCPQFLPQIQEAHDRGIPVAYFISKPAGAEQYTVSVGADDEALGGMLVAIVSDAIHAGSVMLMEGYATAPTNLARKRGAVHALRDHHTLRLSHSLCGGYQRLPAAKAMQAYLNEGGTVDAVIAFNDVMALGVLDALEDANQHAVVVGVNAISEVLNRIKDKRMHATVAFDPAPMAARAVTAIVHHLSGLPHKKDIDLPLAVVTAENIDAFASMRDANPDCV
jgi:ABC-type sugar transport system substrate-binding protein